MHNETVSAPLSPGPVGWSKQSLLLEGTSCFLDDYSCLRCSSANVIVS